MNEQIKDAAMQEALKRADTIAGKVDKLSVDVWNILVHQGQVAAAIAGTELLGLFALKALIIFACMGYSHSTTPDDNFERFLTWIIGFIAIGALTLISASILPTLFTGWLNPQFWAIQTILATMGVK